MGNRERTSVRITVNGHLGNRWKPAFPGMTIREQEDGTTEISGFVADESALHGLLRSVRDGGMTLVGIERGSGHNELKEHSMIGKEETKKQSVIVFGATGRSGRAVVARLLERGHSVTAFVRNPGKIEAGNNRVRIATGDVLDAATVEPAVRGHDAVISCLGAGLKGTVRSEGTRNIITAMHAAGIRRLISQSSLGVGDSRQNLNAYWKYVMFGLLLRKAYRDHHIQERYVRESGLDWTILRPGALTDGPVTGDYVHGFPSSERSISLKLSVADLADFAVRELEEPQYVGGDPALSYREVQ
jgi:uncharacterized protein YbjT (DUF2867 family)